MLRTLKDTLPLRCAVGSRGTCNQRRERTGEEEGEGEAVEDTDTLLEAAAEAERVAMLRDWEGFGLLLGEIVPDGGAVTLGEALALTLAVNEGDSEEESEAALLPVALPEGEGESVPDGGGESETDGDGESEIDAVPDSVAVTVAELDMVTLPLPLADAVSD